MSLASRIQNLFSPARAGGSKSDDHDEHVARGFGLANLVSSNSPRYQETMPAGREEAQDTEGRPPYLHSMLAGGISGTSGDLLMHSIDTVKTRQQGDPHIPPKYTSLSSSYATILRQEGIRRGLYGGVFPAFLGSFPGTIIFFGTYEYTKRHLLDAGISAPLAYLTGGG